MSLTLLIFIIIAVIFIMWLINAYITDPRLRNILNVVMVVAVILCFLSFLGIIGHVSDVRVR